MTKLMYPADGGLKKMVRPLSDTLSAFTVLKAAFFSRYQQRA